MNFELNKGQWPPKFCSFFSPVLNFLEVIVFSISSYVESTCNTLFLYSVAYIWDAVCTCDLLTTVGVQWPCQTFSPLYQFRAKYVMYFHQCLMYCVVNVLITVLGGHLKPTKSLSKKYYCASWYTVISMSYAVRSVSYSVSVLLCWWMLCKHPKLRSCLWLPFSEDYESSVVA